MRALIGVIFALATADALAFQNHCEYRAERNFDVDPSGLKALAFELGSSDLHVEGVAGLGKIEVRGKACASQEAWLADLTVEQQRSGDRVTVKTHHVNTPSSFSISGSNYAYVDLEVRVPKDLRVAVDSSSGDAKISDIAALDYSAHSGDLILNHVAGDVAVEVNSGDVLADDIGSLTIRHAGSGDIVARDVHGEIKVGRIGSGDLGFRDVAKSVHIDSVGSGDVSVAHAGGDVEVGSIGSGDLTVGGIGGDFTVHSAGSGDIHHHDVKGRVQVPNRGDD